MYCDMRRGAGQTKPDYRIKITSIEEVKVDCVAIWGWSDQNQAAPSELIPSYLYEESS